MKYRWIVAIWAAALGVSALWWGQGAAVFSAIDPKSAYEPVIDSAQFSPVIDNAYFSLPVGKKMIYEAKSDGEVERIEITIPGWTKNIMGVDTLVYWDRVYVDGELVEDTRDYLAQDREGNVWYFGENVDNYDKGKLENHEGSWVAGEKGAKPGIWIKGRHTAGDSYRQEYLKGAAEDIRDVVGTGKQVTIGNKTYVDCVQMYDWTPLDGTSKEHKYYCRETASLVLNTHLVNKDREELVSVDLAGGKNAVIPKSYVSEGVKLLSSAMLEKKNAPVLTSTPTLAPMPSSAVPDRSGQKTIPPAGERGTEPRETSAADGMDWSRVALWGVTAVVVAVLLFILVRRRRHKGEESRL